MATPMSRVLRILPALLLPADVDCNDIELHKSEPVIHSCCVTPVQVTIGLLRNALVTNSSGAKCFLIDGFPRELDQAHTFEDSVMPCR